jgi:hypothetical protein
MHEIFESVLYSHIRTYTYSLMRISSLLFFLVFSFSVSQNYLSAQPYFDIANIHYINSPEKKLFDSQDNPSDINYISVQIGLPFKLKEDVLILNPFFERYQLKLQPGTNNTQALNSFGLPVTFLKQWKNPKWKTGFAFIPRLNGDFYKIVGSGYQFGGAVLAIYKKKENLKYKFGVYYNREFFGPFILPLLGIDWNVNERINLFGVLPGNMVLEYRFCSVLFGGINFKSITNSYRFNGLSYLKVSDNYLKLFLDCYLVKNIVINLEAGHSVLRKYTTGNTDKLFVQNKFEDGLLLKAGLSYRIRLAEKK